jgi:predicted glycosyltransferase
LWCAWFAVPGSGIEPDAAHAWMKHDRFMDGASAPRVLFVSGSIGLGHASRDLAIARELRRLLPSVQVAWLAGDPARRLIEEAGEALLPEASELPDETSTAERSAEGASMNIIRYLLRARGAWKQTVSTFEKVITQQPFDLVVGDETYEIEVALHKRPELKKAPFTIIYDFVGMDAMTRNPAEHVMVHMWNRIWCGGPRGRRPPADQVLFIGEPEDVTDRPFGYRLPNRREYALRYYKFVGYVLGFDPAAYSDKAKSRGALGYDDRPLIVCSVGGTAVGAELLERCAAAFPHIERRVPNVRMVLVCGPRIDPASVRAPTGVQVLGYVPRLHEHLAACDLAIVQGGGTTTLELTALRRPFIYVPLEGHCEQEVAVAGRLARHRAGERLSYPQASPQILAERAVRLLGSVPDWPLIPTDGASRAAQLIAELLPSTSAALAA